MDEATIGLIVVTGFVGLVFLGFLIWGIRSGQFHNVEEAKYQVFREQEQTGDENKSKEASQEVKSDAGS
jgi:cbb3-type cytochrome oxidase maturation protein